MYIQPVVEHALHESILLHLFKKYRPEISLHNALGKQGNGYIKSRLKGFNKASKYTPHVILTDLDDTKCAPILISKWIKFTASYSFMLRIAVKEGEAWLLADRAGFSRFIGVPSNRIPINSESITNPKEFIIHLARKSSKRSLRADIIPQGTSSVGPGYNSKMEEFIFSEWNPEEAMKHSDSLKRAVKRIKEYWK